MFDLCVFAAFSFGVRKIMYFSSFVELLCIFKLKMSLFSSLVWISFGRLQKKSLNQVSKMSYCMFYAYSTKQATIVLEPFHDIFPFHEWKIRISRNGNDFHWLNLEKLLTDENDWRADVVVVGGIFFSFPNLCLKWCIIKPFCFITSNLATRA